MLDTELGNEERDNDRPDGSGGDGPGRQTPAQQAAGQQEAAHEAPAQREQTGSPGRREAETGPPAGGGVPPVPMATFQPPQVIFQPPAPPPPAVSRPRGDGGADEAGHEPGPVEDADGGPRRRRRRGGRGRSKAADGGGNGDAADSATGETAEEAAAKPRGPSGSQGDDSRTEGSPRSRRARGGAKDREATAEDAGGRTGTGKPGEPAEPAGDDAGEAAGAGADQGDADADSAGTRRRRRRRRRGAAADTETAVTSDDPPNTVVHVREPRAAASSDWTEVQSVKGSTRLEAKKQRRREGRDSGRRRPPLLSESEFLARREAVQRVMLVRQRDGRTQIAVLEDGVLVEHYVDRVTHQSMAGNIYLGKVQNVLPSMEAAFVDIGKGRNAVLYAGEINFDASGIEGQPKRIETVLKSGQSVLVQVTKDPVGHKGARLTNQVSLPGRYLVYVPGASMTGISRKLPAPERTRLKQILKKVTPEDAGVIVRTAAEGTGEEELTRDVARLAAQWENIEAKAKSATPPELLYSEPDLTIRVVRDIFNEDFSELDVAGDEGWDVVNEYVSYVAPHLAGRVRQWKDDKDLFASYRVDEQIAKALERKVWLPSGGSLVVDRTEAMTVIDVNTGKFTGQGGNLEETVTRNNLEAAEEIVRQLRLRDIGGIIVIDFIDMVLESNRELVLRRLLECLSRDRTKHQVAEVTSLGLVQMTRKRVGSGLLEAFSQPCECCNGRGVHVSLDLLEPSPPKRPAGGGRAAGKGGAKGQAKGSTDGRGRDADEAASGTGAATGAAAGGAEAAPSGERPDKTAEKPSGRRRRRRPGATAASAASAASAAPAAPAADAADGATPAATESAAASTAPSPIEHSEHGERPAPSGQDRGAAEHGAEAAAGPQAAPDTGADWGGQPAGTASAGPVPSVNGPAAATDAAGSGAGTGSGADSGAGAGAGAGTGAGNGSQAAPAAAGPAGETGGDPGPGQPA